jgi:hypothetical protein
MKYYCKKCGSVLIEGDDTRRSNDYEVYCPMCEDENEGEVMMKPIPDYETPQQYGKRTGKAYPDDGAVYYRIPPAAQFRDEWTLREWGYVRKKFIGYWVVIADPPVPPPDNWRPE